MTEKFLNVIYFIYELAYGIYVGIAETSPYILYPFLVALGGFVVYSVVRFVMRL